MFGGNKKGATTTTTSNTTASPEAMAAYRDILARATSTAATPYSAYTGDRVAGFTPDQMAAFDATRAAQGVANPYISEATGFARMGASPIDASAIDRYQNPYTSSVVDTTLADLARSNAIAQQQVTGNAALRGALGGSRVGVAQALTAGEQARAQAPILANLRASGWDKALGAAQQDRNAAAAGASTFGNLGNLAQNAAYRDIGSLYGMGQQQQAYNQALLDVPYQQFMEQRAYPFQTTQWLSDIARGAGTAMGSSTTGTKTDPAPNPWNAILGAAGTVAGAALGGPMGASIGGSLGSSLGGGATTDGWMPVVTKFADGGVVKGYEDGGPIEMEGTGGAPADGGFNVQSIGNPLMQAGLRMMSSTSPYLGVAIGEGGTAGMKAYAENQKAEAERRMKEEQLRLQSEKLMQSAQQHRDTLAERRESRDKERWYPVGPSADPDKPGYHFYDRSSGETILSPISVAPRTGAAGATSVFELKRKAWLELNPGDAAGALDYASGRRSLSEADALRFAEGRAGDAADKANLRGSRRDEFIRNEVSRLMSGFRAAGVRPAVPAAPMGSMGVPTAPMTETPPAAPAPAAPAPGGAVVPKSFTDRLPPAAVAPAPGVGRSFAPSGMIPPAAIRAVDSLIAQRKSADEIRRLWSSAPGAPPLSVLDAYLAEKGIR